MVDLQEILPKVNVLAVLHIPSLLLTQERGGGREQYEKHKSLIADH